MYIPNKKKKYWKLLWVDYFIHKQSIHFQYFWKIQNFHFKRSQIRTVFEPIRPQMGLFCQQTFCLSTYNLFLISKTTFFPNKFLHVFYDFLRKRTQLYPKWSKCIHIPFIVLQSEVCTKRFINISSNIEINTANTYQSF